MSDYQKPTFNFFDDSNQSKKNMRMSKKQENKIAKMGSQGKRTPGSGNKGIKGDVWKKGVQHKHSSIVGRMYEAKTTEGKSIKIQMEWLKKLEKESWGQNKEPVFVFGFLGGQLLTEDWGAVPLDRLEELFEIERKYHEEE